MLDAPLAPNPAPGLAFTTVENRVALSPAEAAQALGITRQTVYALIKRGELRACKVGRCTRIPVGDVLALVGGDPNAA